MAGDKKTTMIGDSSDEEEYVEPARTSYPEDQGILNSFAARAKKQSPRDPDDMEFD